MTEWQEKQEKEHNKNLLRSEIDIEFLLTLRYRGLSIEEMGRPELLGLISFLYKIGQKNDAWKDMYDGHK